jgi:hypothetical protein
MKLLCAPLDFDFAGAAEADLEVILYAHADQKTRAGVGGSIRSVIDRRKLKPAPRAWDFLSIALSVIAADTGVWRSGSPDGWTRELDVSIAVADAPFWTANRELLVSALRFLTTDIWRLTFLAGGASPTPPQVPTFPVEDCVALLSGGLDSLVGVIDLTARNQRKPYVVSQVAQGDKKKQTLFASKIGGGLSHLQLNHVARFPFASERSQRARSMIFFAYGVLLATSLQRYHKGETIPLYVCENGFISINPPLTPGRLGSLSTRTTHPVYLGLLQRLLDQAGLRVQIQNPCQFTTKGEMLAQCADQKLLRELAPLTTSCGRYARNAYSHCGRCVPCLIRRASFLTWKQKDKTDYVFHDLSKDDNHHAGFDDVRAAAMAVETVRSVGIETWIGSSLDSPLIPDTGPYQKMIARGLRELKKLLTDFGVK